MNQDRAGGTGFLLVSETTCLKVYAVSNKKC